MDLAVTLGHRAKLVVCESLGGESMAGNPEEILAKVLHPGERVILRIQGNLHRAFSFRFKDLLFLTNERVLTVICQANAFHLANTLALEDLPQTTWYQPNTLIIAGAKFQVWRSEVGSIANTIENQRVRRLQSISARRTAPGVAPNIPVIREKEIIREVVKIPCRYCGRLNLMTDKKCSGCGVGIS